MSSRRAGKRTLNLDPAQVAAASAAVRKAESELEQTQRRSERDRKAAQKALDRAQQSSAGAPVESRARRELARAQLRLADRSLNTLLVYGLFTVGVLVGLQFIGVGLSSLALLAGVVGMGIGFGLRNIAENFISGLIILLERPLKIGDWIDVDGAIEGQVQHVRARSTTVLTRDNISVIIPNSEFVGQRITNWSHGDPRVRIRVDVGVAYGSDVHLVRRCLIEVARRHGKILTRPAPEVQFIAFGDSSLNFALLAWIQEQEHRFRIASDLRFAIDAVFRRTGVTIPFPQRDLHVKSVDFSALRAARSTEETAAQATGDPISHVEAVLTNARHADAEDWEGWADRWGSDNWPETSAAAPAGRARRPAGRPR